MPSLIDCQKKSIQSLYTVVLSYLNRVYIQSSEEMQQSDWFILSLWNVSDDVSD